MFIKQTGFEKMLKKTVKGYGLRVEHTADLTEDGEITNANYILSGASWCLEIREDVLEKEAKGALIKLVGDLPKYGEAVRVTEKEYSQEEITGTGGIYNGWENWRKAKEIALTEMIWQGDKIELRLLQERKGTLHAINDFYVSIVDKETVKVDDGETIPYEWRYNRNYGAIMIANNWMVLTVLTADVKDDTEKMFNEIACSGIILPECEAI